MSTTLPFGNSQSCQLTLGDHTVLAPNSRDAREIEDPAEETRTALAAPQGYPPLAAATVPGDRVAIAVGEGIPKLPSILQGAIAALIQSGVDAERIVIVSTGPQAEIDELRATLIAKHPGLSFRRHAADHEPTLAMVGMTAAGRSLRFNRTLAEADVILPIGLASRHAGSVPGPTKFGGLFPQFSNRETIERFRGAGAGTAKVREEQAAEVDEAGWLLGIGLAVRVVPGIGGAVAAVLAGEPKTVAQAAAQQFQAIWERPAPQAGDLVIAALAGDDNEQTWDNVARAIQASERVVRADGAIAIYCELADTPPRAFETLVDAVDYGAVRQKLRRDSGQDARAARILAHALQRGPVYLRSHLPAEVVESLGMTPIESDAELARLAAGREYCVVIEEAQRVRPRLGGTEQS